MPTMSGVLGLRWCLRIGISEVPGDIDDDDCISRTTHLVWSYYFINEKKWERYLFKVILEVGVQAVAPDS